MKKSKRKGGSPVLLERLVSLRRNWLLKAKKYRSSRGWICNDEASKQHRECIAEWLEYCASELRAIYLGRAD